MNALKRPTPSTQVAGILAVAFVLLAVLPLRADPEESGKALPPEPPPVASAASEDGRFHLDVSHVEVEPPAPGSTSNPTVMLQGRIRLDGPRLLVGPDLRVRRVTLPDASEAKPQSYGHVGHATYAHFAFHGLDVGPEPEGISLLEIEATILRLRDAEHRYDGIEPGDPVSKLLPPYLLSLSAEPHAVHVGACMTDESIRAAKWDVRDVWPGHDAIASSARVVDANGQTLMKMAGTGTGGFSSVTYGGGLVGGKVAFPVTITIPDPTPVERIPTLFRLRDLKLPPVRNRRVSASPWGEPSSGLAIRADVPTRVEQGERVAATIELVRQETGLPEGVTRLEPRNAEAFLQLRLTPQGAAEPVIVIRPDDPSMGMPDWPEPCEPEPNLNGKRPDLPPIPAVFPLVLAYAALPPGRYEGLVELSVPDESKRRSFYENEAGRLWRGTVTSGTFPLEIVAEPSRTRTIRVPTKLHFAKGRNLRLLTEDSEEVTLPRRNGYFIGTVVDYAYSSPSGNLPVMSETSAFPYSSSLNPLLTLPADYRGPFEAKITIRVFHTIDAPAHMWPKTAPETLWERTYPLSYSAAEVETLR